MLGNVYNQPEKRIDEREIARISVEFDTVDSSYIGRRVFAAAIEALYDVKVVAVSTQNRQGKKRRTRKGVGCTKSWKKAMVKLDDEYRLDLY